MTFHKPHLPHRSYRPHQLGKSGEDEAVRYLKDINYEILERNWRSAKGEIDIIALHRVNGVAEVVFVEVKTRTNTLFGDPFEAITPEKYRRMYLLAREWMVLNQSRLPWRIDVILLLKQGLGFEIIHHKGLIA